MSVAVSFELWKSDDQFTYIHHVPHVYYSNITFIYIHICGAIKDIYKVLIKRHETDEKTTSKRTNSKKF